MQILKCLIVGLGFLTTSAQAEVFKVSEKELSNRYNYDVSATFAVNQDPARAWVEVTFKEKVPANSDLSPDKEIQRVKLPGLKYDSNTKEILMDSSGESVVCARLVKQGFLFQYEMIRLTESCSFQFERVTKEVTRDDGYRTWKEDLSAVTVNLLVNER